MTFTTEHVMKGQEKINMAGNVLSTRAFVVAH